MSVPSEQRLESRLQAGQSLYCMNSHFYFRIYKIYIAIALAASLKLYCSSPNQ